MVRRQTVPPAEKQRDREADILTVQRNMVYFTAGSGQSFRPELSETVPGSLSRGGTVEGKSLSVSMLEGLGPGANVFPHNGKKHTTNYSQNRS